VSLVFFRAASTRAYYDVTVWCILFLTSFSEQSVSIGICVLRIQILHEQKNKIELTPQIDVDAI
jgi:hypothetical protein